MKTDTSIYKFLAMGAEAFRVLTGGLTLSGPYRFTSLTLKALERRIDGVFEPDGNDGPVYLVEFQGQYSNTAWYNLMGKLALYGETHPDSDARGILVFLHSSLDPCHSKGGAKEHAGGLLQAVYLDHFLPDWLAREPNNPYLAVLAPLVLESDLLRQKAPELWQAIQQAPVTPEIRENLSEILAFWFFEHFKSLTKKEIWAMLNVLTPLQETRAYQEIFAEGRAKGAAEGEAKGEAKSLKRFLARRFGLLPDWAIHQLDNASIEQLDAWLDAIHEAKSITDLLGGGLH
jgi:predicted transposase YdaD